MISFIIFSKNRACQLNLLLESIEYLGDKDIQIEILFATDEENFAEGYRILEKKFRDNLNINWTKEKDFRTDLLRIIEKSKEYTCFFTDDDVLYRKFEMAEITDFLKSDPDLFCFSLRLGLNTKICYTRNSVNILLDYQFWENKIRWNWQNHQVIDFTYVRDFLAKRPEVEKWLEELKKLGKDLNIFNNEQRLIYPDFGYPFSFDGHIFRTFEIRSLVNNLSFFSPNSLEQKLHELHYFLKFPRAKMACFIDSCLVNIPVNRVQGDFLNRYGENYHFSEKKLNDKFLSGGKIDFSLLPLNNVSSSHQEMSLSFCQR